MGWFRNKSKKTGTIEELLTNVTNKRYDRINILLKSGVNINSANKNGITPLILAISGNNASMAEYLLEKGADANNTLADGTSPLILAVMVNNLNIVDCLLKEGANINGANEDGLNALMIAVIENKLDMVDYLLKKGADVNDGHVDKMGIIDTPLSIAGSIKPINYKMVELLLDNGATFNDGDLVIFEKNHMLLHILEKYKNNYSNKPKEANINEMINKYKSLPPQVLEKAYIPPDIKKELKRRGII